MEAVDIADLGLAEHPNNDIPRWLLPEVPAPADVPKHYAVWVREHYPTPESARHRCQGATYALVKAFPELRQARGYFCWPHGSCEHWWAIAPDGTVVDPTVHQFIRVNLLGCSYQELTDEEVEQHVPSGVCAECGFSTYRGAYFCSDECREDYTHYMNSSLR